MLKNYFKTAFRNLLRNKGYAFINITGLAVGIAACLLIFLVIQFETSFDNFHKKKDEIFRVSTVFTTPEGVDYSSGAPLPVAEALRLDYPQLKLVAAINASNNDQVTISDNNNEPEKKFKEERGIFYAEPEFFSMFDFKWLAGDAKTALKEPNTAVLTKETAEKYFGDWKTAIGKTIKHENKNVYKITGILENIPANTDFPLKVVISFVTLKNTGIANNVDDWISVSSNSNCFILKPQNISTAQFNSYLAAFVKKHKPAEYAKDGLILQPLKDIHYDDRFGNFSQRTFSKDLITALSLICLFLLIIACVNFVNLATAQAVNRAKEVGIRKVLGSNRKQLMWQFLGETIIITFLALFIAVIIAAAALPLLNNLLKIHLSFNPVNNPAIFIFLLSILVIVSALSGFYPALILSGFNPINALKSKIASKSAGGVSLRRGLVVFQFVIAQGLIIGTIVVVTQMNYFRSANLGFNKTSILNVPVPGDSITRTQLGSLRNQLLQQPGITNVSFSFASPSDKSNWWSDFKFNHTAKSTDFGANLKWADATYFKTYDLQFVAGRPYYETDTVHEFVVNETLVKKLGVRNPQDAIGKEINFWDGQKTGLIVGVVKDFHANSLRDPVGPIVMACWKDVYQTISIKIKPGNTKASLAGIEKLWTTTFPAYVYEHQFLDEKIDNFYSQENQLSQLYKIFAAIAIFISCLGLYGLVSFMVVQRTKEVGIRKVLGANVANIIYLLSKEFTLLIIIAFVIAGPVAYYIMHKWLQNYTYRIHLGASIFLIAIIGSIIIAWITVGHRAIKAALANPVKSLRTE